MGVFATLLVVLVATSTATAQAAFVPTHCHSDDTGCLEFAGNPDRSLPEKGGTPQPVFIGSWVYMLTSWGRSANAGALR